MDSIDFDAVPRMPPPEVVDASVQPYIHLVERATTFLADCGGRAHEDALVSHVFGTAGSPMLWRPLLNTMFQRETDIVLRAGGFWCLRSAHAESTTLLVADFVALDVETTGLHAYRQRIIEIALIRYRDGAATARFESFVNPGRSIPAYISKLTGIRDLDVAEAPPFTEIAPDVLDFIGQDRLVGHNVGFDISFVNAELKRAGCGALINERLDTLGLATRLLPNLKKPNLDRVALELGVALSARKLHRAANDAELSGESMLCLAKLAQQQGVQTISDLYAISSRSGHRPHERVGRGRSVLDRSLLATLPKTPGVYLMHDAFDQIVYVGKAKNLRDRVASYYSQPLGYTRKMDGLLESLSRIEVEVVGSELEALLLESQLIKRYQPRYNTALRSFEH
ncbi:MAG: exonuclease domain-containing protein, partial [Chloroflexota bacterium]|nr:exonuclease domain-containing protein [Chloroflexota bacterium]